MSGRPGPRKLVVCIDDYALGPGVDAAVLELAARGRVSATSCMVGLARWPAAAAALRSLAPGTIDTGLHLDFTEAPLDRSLRSGLGAFIARAYLGALPARRIAAEVAAQFDAFEQAMGRPPDHVDGHQHVHQLPVVRDALFDQMQRRGLQRAWLRGTRAPRREPGLKPGVIAALGGARLRAMAGARGIPVSGCLLGVYGFDADAAGYRQLLAGWLQRAAEGDVLMCHPARSEGSPAGDPIATARLIEHGVLASEAWPELLAQAGVAVGRFVPA
ncbi:MAG: ChbG/HpnK family deacetylase [Ramlibacter sp.]